MEGDDERLTQREPTRSMGALGTPARIDQRRTAQIALLHARREGFAHKGGIPAELFLEPAKRRSAAHSGFFSHHFNRDKYARGEQIALTNFRQPRAGKDETRQK
jgi:hypothetical protein